MASINILNNCMNGYRNKYLFKDSILKVTVSSVIRFKIWLLSQNGLELSDMGGKY